MTTRYFSMGYPPGLSQPLRPGRMIDDVLGIMWYRKRGLMIGHYVVSVNALVENVDTERLIFREPRGESHNNLLSDVINDNAN